MLDSQVFLSEKKMRKIDVVGMMFSSKTFLRTLLKRLGRLRTIVMDLLSLEIATTIDFFHCLIFKEDWCSDKIYGSSYIW